MRRFLVALTLLAAGCPADPIEPPPVAELRISRDGGGFAIELAGLSAAPRALQAEITIDSTSAYLIEGAEAPAGLPLDTVRIEMRGANRAMLFVGDKRGIRLPRDGVVARFELVPSTADEGPGTLAIKSALVVGTDGARLEVQPGAATSIR